MRDLKRFLPYAVIFLWVIQIPVAGQETTFPTTVSEWTRPRRRALNRPSTGQIKRSRSMKPRWRPATPLGFGRPLWRYRRTRRNSPGKRRQERSVQEPVKPGFGRGTNTDQSDYQATVGATVRCISSRRVVFRGDQSFRSRQSGTGLGRNGPSQGKRRSA